VRLSSCTAPVEEGGPEGKLGLGENPSQPENAGPGGLDGGVCPESAVPAGGLHPAEAWSLAGAIRAQCFRALPNRPAFILARYRGGGAAAASWHSTRSAFAVAGPRDLGRLTAFMASGSLGPMAGIDTADCLRSFAISRGGMTKALIEDLWRVWERMGLAVGFSLQGKAIVDTGLDARVALAAKPSREWRPLGDSNPCCRRERRANSWFRPTGRTQNPR
jgi:hypothetical protein